MDRRTALRLAVAAAATMGASTGKKPPTPQPRQVSYRGFNSDTDFASGTGAGVQIAGGAVVFAGPVGQRSYLGAAYDYATWTSPSVPLGFAATEAVPSWTADTP